MRIEHDGHIYKLEFARYLEDGKDGIVTEARLFRWLENATPPGTWLPIATGKARRWVSRSKKHVDANSREAGRRHALAKMALHLERSLGGAVKHAYYNRPHDPDPKALIARINALQADLFRLERKQRERSTP